MTTYTQRNGHQAGPVTGTDIHDASGHSGRALLVASDPAVQRDLAGLLTRLGHEVVTAGSARHAQRVLEKSRFAFTVLDLDVEGNDGYEFLRRLKVQASESGPLVVLSRQGELPAGAETNALGVVDFLREPVTRGDLAAAIKNALCRVRRGRSPAGEERRVRLDEEQALWSSPRMREIRNTIKLIAGADVSVLVCGETGTGKDVVARSIHHHSARRDRPFVKVNCAALPRDLLESELFGHERGSFTGAHELKIGQFERANHGTIFLDEIGDLHPDLQGKLLHVLQDGQFSRVGGRSTIKVDVRILAATNQDLERNVAAGTFREDLLYRLNVIQIAVPPLRDRREEIPALAQYFVRHYCQLFRREPFELAPETMQRLMQHRYAGNVRELENIIKRMIVLNDPDLAKNGLPSSPAAGPATGASTPAGPATISLKDIGRRAAQDAERAAILQMLEQTRWNRLRAAKLLNISYRALLYKIKDAGIGAERADSNAHA
jgi:two-component system response regulator AtoC